MFNASGTQRQETYALLASFINTHTQTPFLCLGNSFTSKEPQGKILEIPSMFLSLLPLKFFLSLLLLVYVVGAML